MEIEYVLMNCDDCGIKNKYNWLLTTTNNYSITLCEECIEKLNKQIKERL